MKPSRVTRTLWACAVVLVAALTGPLPLSAQGQEQVTICHRTGSSTAPWVLMIIDARLWPEYQAQGDKRAASLADCADPPAVPALPAQAPVTQQQPVAPSTPLPIPTVAAPTPVLATAATPRPTVETAGVAVAPAAAAQSTPPQAALGSTVAQDAGAESTTAPDVSNLPKSGEPDRVSLVLGLMALALAGVTLRRLTRGRA
jgi:hypothetical protein